MFFTGANLRELKSGMRVEMYSNLRLIDQWRTCLFRYVAVGTIVALISLSELVKWSTRQRVEWHVNQRTY
jgi:hypothetical protein